VILAGPLLKAIATDALPTSRAKAANNALRDSLAILASLAEPVLPTPTATMEEAATEPAFVLWAGRKELPETVTLVLKDLLERIVTSVLRVITGLNVPLAKTAFMEPALAELIAMAAASAILLTV